MSLEQYAHLDESPGQGGVLAPAPHGAGHAAPAQPGAEPPPLSLGAAARGAERFTLRVRTAKLVVDGREYLCVMRDASATGVKLRLFHPLPVGEATALELSNGDRHPMRLRWENKDHAGFQFDTPVDVRALIDDRGQYPKRQVRVSVNREVIVNAHNREFPAMLRNISQNGACLECPERMLLHETARIQIPGFPLIVARMCWRDHPRYGMVFEGGFGLQELARMLAPLQAGPR